MASQAELKYEELTFEEREDSVRISFLNNYYFEVLSSELRDIADFRLTKNSIIFEANEKRAQNKFNLVLSKGFLNLKNKLTGRKTIYIHRDSGIPLIGNNAFGLIDRNTSIIEVKPATGCNLDCVFCSVDEGPGGKWATDFIVEPDYLVEEFEKLAEFKGAAELEAHIGTHGEPLLYPRIIELVRGLKAIPSVKRISFDTNGTLLTKKLIDELAEAGLTKIHLSLNAIDPKVAEKLAGCPYNTAHVIEMARYASKRLGLLIAPIWVPGFNDEEMPKLVEFAKELGARIAIQNFLSYRFGRNPAKQLDWEDFFSKMRLLEQKYGVQLLFNETDFQIEKTKQLPKPFRKGQVVKAEIVCDGRLKGEKIAVALDRNISIPDCDKKGTIRVKITREKHNIYFGTCAR
jgi:uncharacterized Fe-S cluster-containing radical SAM superfamily enzyme